MLERTAIPGFSRGRRHIALVGAPEYFNLYEADSAAALGGADYLARLNSPTPWTRQVVASFRNVVRGICRVLYSGGIGQGGCMLTLRFDVPDAKADAVAATLCQNLLPALVGAKRIAGVHLCRTDAETSAIETAENKARSEGTRIPGWVLMLEGVNAGAVQAAVARLRADLVPLGASAFDQACYQLAHQRCKLPSASHFWRPSEAWIPSHFTSSTTKLQVWSTCMNLASSACTSARTSGRASLSVKALKFASSVNQSSVIASNPGCVWPSGWRATAPMKLRR